MMYNQIDTGIPHDECGVCGVFGHPEAARLTYFGLYSLQHRGQKSAGMVSHDGHGTWTHRAIGLVSEIFTEEYLQSLKGKTAMGHVLDSSASDIRISNAQPFTATHRGKTISVAHNGSITNIRQLRSDLETKGAIFHSEISSETVVHYLARCVDSDLASALLSTFTGIEGAFSMLLLVDGTLVAVRDPHGFRPLCLGRLDNGGYVVASETCAFDLLGARYLRDVAPGEILLIDSNGLRSVYLPKKCPSFCLFEQVYFARPDSTIFGVSVYQSRKRMGEALAKECRVEADLVMPFLDSGLYAALGFAQATAIPFELGLIRNHYVGRTFMQSARSDRAIAVRMKFNPVRSLVRGKRVILVDDSAVSGATVANMIRLLREAGAREVHLLVSCPPIRFSCAYGVHFPERDRLLAHGKTIDQIRDSLGLDTLHYLSLDGLIRAAGGGSNAYCKSCMDPANL